MLTLTVTPTDATCELDGVPVRLWKGVDDEGLEYLVFVHRVATHSVAAQEKLSAALEERWEPKNWAAVRKEIESR